MITHLLAALLTLFALQAYAEDSKNPMERVEKSLETINQKYEVLKKQLEEGRLDRFTATQKEGKDSDEDKDDDEEDAVKSPKKSCRYYHKQIAWYQSRKEQGYTLSQGKFYDERIKLYKTLLKAQCREEADDSEE